MAVKREMNWLSQMRVDVPHLRLIEKAVVGDIDDLAGKIIASSRPIIVNGFTLSMGAAVSNPATQLVLNTASSILLHGTASEPGAIFVVPASQPAETLSTSNPVVIGGFTPNAINYIGIDLIKKVDPTTVDTVKFRSATTKKEFSQQVPLARTLSYRIVISAQDFTVTTNVAPVAKVTLDTNGLVLDVTDCREMMFRLGSGGTAPNALDVFSWPGGRTENPVTSTTTTDPFSGADKSISSFIDFHHALESRLWEVGGGEHWYSATTDRDVLFVRDPGTVFVSNNENFEWTGTNLHWKGVSYAFGNSTAITNSITNQTIDDTTTVQPNGETGLTNLSIGDCIYVDVNRANNAAVLSAHRSSISNLGTPAIPGSRHIIAWRVAAGVFGLGNVEPVGFALTHATALAYGVTKLWKATDTDAIVSTVDSNGVVTARGLSRKYDSAGNVVIGADTNDLEVSISRPTQSTHVYGSLTVNQGVTGNNSVALGTGGAFTGGAGGIGATGLGIGAAGGVAGTGGNSGGYGVLGQGGNTNGDGGQFTGGITNGRGLTATSAGDGIGAEVTSNGTGSAVSGICNGSGHGVYGSGGDFGVYGTGAIGVYGISNTGFHGVKGECSGAGLAVYASSSGTGGAFSADASTGTGYAGNFVANTNKANIHLSGLIANPSTPANGDIYYNSNTNHFYGYNGAWKQLDN